MIWKRDQKASETEEANATGLKCIYDKAYLQHGYFAWDDHLLHRSWNGLLDQKAWQEIMFVKDPAIIDDAWDEVGKYQETQQSGSLTRVGTGQHHARAAHMNAVQLRLLMHQIIVKMRLTVESLMSPNLSIKINRFCQMFLKKTQEWWSGGNGESCKKTFFVEVGKNLNELFAQQDNNGSKGSPQNPNKNQGNYNNGKGTQRGTGKCNQGGPLKCYNCQQSRHMACECHAVACNCTFDVTAGNARTYAIFQSGKWSTKGSNVGKCETCKEWHVLGPLTAPTPDQQLLN